MPDLQASDESDAKVQRLSLHEAIDHGKYSCVRRLDIQRLQDILRTNEKETHKAIQKAIKNDKEDEEDISSEDVQAVDAAPSRTTPDSIDFTASGFPKAPPFPVSCDPIEFGDLGAGFPLYFDFVKFLGVLCCFWLALFAPVMVGIYHTGKFQDDWNTESVQFSLYLTYLMSAGNLGDARGSSYFPAIITLAATCLMLFLWPHFVRRQVRYDKLLDEEAVHPNDFAIVVRGLPADAVAEEEIAEFFRAHSLGGGQRCSVIKVVVAFDLRKHYELIQKQLRLQTRIDSLKRKEAKKAKQEDKRRCCNCTRLCIPPCCSGGDVKGITASSKTLLLQLRHISRQLRSLDYQGLKSSGTAIVVFKSQQVHRDCIHRWQVTWNASLRRFLRPELPKFRGIHTLQVKRAPNPSDILWQNLGTSFKEQLLAKVGTYTIVVLLLLLSLFVTTILVILNVKIRNKDYIIEETDIMAFMDGAVQILNAGAGGSSTGFFLLSLLPSLFISMINMLLRSVVLFLTNFERHATVTSQDSSSMIKLTLAMTLNTAMVYMIVLRNPAYWYVRGGLVESIFIQLLFNLAWEPIAEILSINERLQRFYARHINLAETSMTQQQLNRLFEGPAFDGPSRYAGTLKSFTLVATYMPVFPFGLVIAIITFAVHYWVDKYHLLRMCKRPYVQSAFLVISARWMIRIFLFLLPGLSIYLLPPSFLSSLWPSIFRLGIIGLIFAAIGFVIPPDFYDKFCMTFICQPKTSFEEDQFEALNYYDAQQLFFEHYHTTNPVYRALPKECNPTLLVEVADADEKAMTKISEPTLKEAAKFEEVSVDIQEDDLQGRGMSLPEISQSLSTPAFARRAVSIVNTNRIHELLHEVRKQLSSLKKRMLQAYAHWFCRLTKHL
eukprot:GHVT01032214.1.p1 GENE.GHVT01032214.1~~GHVT01032214.1.p1  ORF type:complete len:889 (-),score=65.88 GHVT01032214.1:1189-3855(-)